MRKLSILPIVFIIVLSSCNPNKIYNKHQNLSPNLEWKKSKKIEYKVTIEDTDAKYNISTALRFISGYMFTTLKMKATISSPTGETIERFYTMNIVDENKKYRGEGMGDYWDLEDVVDKDFDFNASGVYTFVIEHDMPKDPLPFVMELGLVVEKIVE